MKTLPLRRLVLQISKCSLPVIVLFLLVVSAGAQEMTQEIVERGAHHRVGISVISSGSSGYGINSVPIISSATGEKFMKKCKDVLFLCAFRL